ncbi:MAG: hypothetical protein ACP8RL_03840 [cyanobacterium endosymbiont of Rhopalodia inflata]
MSDLVDNQGIRFVVFDCGVVYVFDILTKIDRLNLDLSRQHKRILPSDDLFLFLGRDIGQAMVEKRQVLFSEYPHI